MSKTFDLNGKQFGRLTVICEGEKAKSGERRWVCKCSCGVITNPIKSTCLRQGITQSCGCLQKEIVAQRLKTHNKSRSRIYGIWATMKWRCTNQKASVYKHYGGRGISVCEEWNNSFEAFYDYVSQLPHFDEKGYSLDRINNNGNYEPNNVRWATQKEQCNNRRPTKKE